MGIMGSSRGIKLKNNRWQNRNNPPQGYFVGLAQARANRIPVILNPWCNYKIRVGQGGSVCLIILPQSEKTCRNQAERTQAEEHSEVVSLLSAVIGYYAAEGKAYQNGGHPYEYACCGRCFEVVRAVYTPTDTEPIPESPTTLRVAGKSVLVIASTWRSCPHLKPRSRYTPALIPHCYWLLLLARDVKLNPRPIKYSCTVCKRPVRNVTGVNIGPTHTYCCGISRDDMRCWAPKVTPANGSALHVPCLYSLC